LIFHSIFIGILDAKFFSLFGIWNTSYWLFIVEGRLYGKLSLAEDIMDVLRDPPEDDDSALDALDSDFKLSRSDIRRSGSQELILWNSGFCCYTIYPAGR